MISVRPARPNDQETLGRYGGALARQHYSDDPHRFIRVENPEASYGRYLVSQISGPDSAVFVAENQGTVIGYVWTTLEGTDWAKLRGPCGIVQDIYVDPTARQRGAGRALLTAALDWIRSKGRSMVVLMTKTRNESAHRLFTSFGFRPTMIEMTLDAEDGEARG